MRVTLGVDIGTFNSKGVLVDDCGIIVRAAQRRHEVRRQHARWVEMDAEIWWNHFVAIVADVTAKTCVDMTAIGAGGMGPCVLVTDVEGQPLRPAILYGVDTRATVGIGELAARLGAPEVLERKGSALTAQAVGPKLAWLAQYEPDVQPTDITEWNPPASVFQPNVSRATDCDELFKPYRQLQPAVNDVSHVLAQS